MHSLSAELPASPLSSENLYQLRNVCLRIIFNQKQRFGSLDASINRQFLKQKLTVTLSAIDILNANKNEFTIDQGSISASGMRRGDTHRFGSNLRYNFGIRKKEESANIFNIGPMGNTN